VLIALGLIACPPKDEEDSDGMSPCLSVVPYDSDFGACLDVDTDVDADTDSDTDDSDDTDVSPCLGALDSEDRDTDFGPCLDADADADADTDSDTDVDDSDDSGGIDSDADSGGPDSGAAGARAAPERDRVLRRLLARGVLPADVAARQYAAFEEP